MHRWQLQQAMKRIDRVDNELGFSYRKVTATKAKEITQARSAHLRAHMAKMVTWSMQKKQLKRIRIPKFSGDKKEYQSWWAAFSSCVDEINLSAQFKMLQLESSSVGEAAETVKGLGYSDHACEAAKARLNLKYGVNRRQVRAHIDEANKR